MPLVAFSLIAGGTIDGKLYTEPHSTAQGLWPGHGALRAPDGCANPLHRIGRRSGLLLHHEAELSKSVDAAALMGASNLSHGTNTAQAVALSTFA